MGSRALPSGTVTLLFADVEGSVRLWESDQAAMRAAMKTLEELADEAIEQLGGVRPVEQGEGDNLVAVFERASDAVACAVAIQLAIEHADIEPRFRMALHTGEVEVRDGAGYDGEAMNRCARLRDAAHGGQILLSRTTHDLVADRADLTCVKLGTHQLRDMARAEEVFQVVHAELRSVFPALRTPSGPPSNLPRQLASFVGREAEVAAVAEILTEARLVTLTGAGGCGKTRLGIEVAGRLVDRYPDGVWWVDLARLSDPALVPSAVASALGITEQPGRPITESVRSHLAGRSALLVVDNCEHVIDPCAELIDDLVGACPGVSVLATSREPIGVRGEVAWRVPSLGVPERGALTADALSAYDAVRLFIDRAVRVRPNFEVTDSNAQAIAEVCVRLDGIPLAIELAASRTRMMTPEQILAGLDDRFRLLTGTQRGVLPRHRTLEASVDWSYDLLGHSERTMLERLSVFRGGFTLDAAEHVGSGSGLERVEALELLSSLVDRSLVQVDEGGAEARYHLLETVRQYAADRLAASGAEADTRTRHLDAYVALAERMESRFVGASLTDTLDLLDLEHANLRAAMDHAQRSGQAEKALRIVAGIWRYWRIRGNVAEGRRRVETAIEADDTDAHVRARALLGACQLAIIDYTPAWARAFAEEALLLARRIGDERMIARAAVALGRALGFREPDAARPLLEEAIELCTRTGDQEPLGQALFGRYQTRWGVGDLRGARRCLDDVVAHYRALSDPHRLGSCLGVLGQTVTFHGDLEAAGRAHAESAEVMRTFGDRLFEDWALAGLAWILALRGECERAVASLEEVVSRTRTADSPFIANYLIYLAQAELALGRLDLADLHADEAIASLLETNPYLSKVPARIRCDTLRLRGDLEEASRVLDDEMDGSTPRTGVWWGYALEGQGRLLRVRGDTQDSEDVHHEALRLLIDGGGLLFVPDTLESLAGLAAMAESDEEASRLFAAAEVQRERMGTVRFAVEQDGYEADVALARERLSDEDFERAWAEGRAMSLEEAVAYASRGRGERKRPSAGWASLTPTELDVVKLVAEGLTNPQIAERMFVARATVKAHLSNVFRKLGVSSRAELATEVTRRGL